MEKFMLIIGAMILSSYNTSDKAQPKAEVKEIISVSDTQTIDNSKTKSLHLFTKGEAIKDPLEGRHGLTIQWLTFNNSKRGIVSIIKQKDEWYSIKGQQQNAEGYLKIDGRIRIVNPKELLFDGIITYEIQSMNNGALCKKQGEQTFLSTKDRKYWRMQDMASCEGGTTDYIDIFF